MSLLLVPLLVNWGACAQGPSWQTAMTVGQVGGVNAAATASDANGNVYLAGSFSGTVSFGSATLTSAGGSDVLLAKWNPASSNFVWVQRAGGAGNDYCTALAVNGVNVYVVGGFQSAVASFGSTTLANSTLSLANHSDGFVAKLADAGAASSFEWAQKIGGDDNNSVAAVGVNGASVYVTGNFGGRTANFGSISNNTQGVRTAVDVFVAKLTDVGTAGSWMWARQAGGGLDDSSNTLAVSGNNIYIAGAFSGQIAGFGGITLTNANLNSSPLGGSNPSEAFVAKLVDAGGTGDFIWAQRAGGIGEDRAKAVAVSGTSVYVAGSFSGPTAGIGATTLVNNGDTDGFVTKIIDAGSASAFSWARPIGSAGSEDVAAVAVNGTNVYVAGSFGSSTVNLGGTQLTCAGLYDVFVAKLSDAGNASSWAWAQQAGSINYDGAYGMALNGATLYLTGYIRGVASFGALTTTGSSAGSAFLASITDLLLTASKPVLHSETISLYPSPAHATTTVQLPPLPGAATATLTLLDALGRDVRTATVALSAAGLRRELDLAGLPAGLYALRVAAGGHIATRSLVVE